MEALHILADPAHWIAEVVMDTVFNTVWILTVGRAAIWWHDRRKHGGDEH